MSDLLRRVIYSFSFHALDKKAFSDSQWEDVQALLKVVSKDKLPKVGLSAEDILPMINELRNNKAAFKVMKNEMT